MSTMQATKTLIIGLGSTGTRVCNGILRRLEWEYGSAERAPWVQFLAVETNNNEPTPLRQRGDFFPIGLDARSYGQILEDPQSHRRINLDRWADMATLRKLKDTEGGAGNIRMIGRLTFMTDPNFSRVKLALLSRLSTLRQLSENEAFQARGELPDGSNPELLFGSGGQVRVFVVGTLCGGTGSGLSPDFGYFLRSVPLRDEEKIIGVFTLPHEHLTSVVASSAERLKRNAYHALLELNHYHQANADTLPPILYPDGTSANLQLQPYDLPYLVGPSAPTKQAETELNELVADRIFMNIVNPEADPFSKSVDAPMPDRDHQAHVFSTFGLSVVDFPAPQITEAASKLLLHGALSQWQGLDTGRAQNLAGVLGLDWASLVSALLGRSADEWQGDAVKAAIAETEEAKPDFLKLDRALGELRRQVAPDGGLSEQLRARREQVVETAYLKFQQHAQTALLDRTYGPQVLAAEVSALLEHLQGLHDAARESTSAAQAESGEAWRRVDEGTAQLKAELKRKSFLNPNRATIEKAQAELRKAIRDFARTQIESGVHASIQTHHTYGVIDPGVAEHLQRLLTRVQGNLRSLDARVTALKNRIYRDYEARSGELPPVNGWVLLEPRTTVQQEYRRALEAGKHSSIEHLDNIEARLHGEIIQTWTDLPTAVVPPMKQTGEGWLSASFDPRGDHLIPPGDYQGLLAAATRPFARQLSQENVVERVMRQSQTTPGTEGKIRAAAEKAAPFLRLNRLKAESGNRSPVMSRQSLLMPPRTDPGDAANFQQVVGSAFSQANTVNLTSPDPTRVLFMEEYFRFPLRGLDQVLGEGGLQAAESNDFPTFHTRRDVQWYGLSRREGQLLADAEEALILGVLLGDVEVRDGLNIPWTVTGFGDRNHRRLPANLAEASRVLARGEQDQDGYSLLGGLPTLQSKIEGHWRRPDMPLEESAQAFVELLQHRLQEFYQRGRAGQIGGWGSQIWAGDQIARYTAKHRQLAEAVGHLFLPAPEIMNALRLRQYQRGAWGGEAPADGLYCPQCGGEIGKDEKEAALNGWRCAIDSTHYYGRGAALQRI